jgi:hypothetical protein
VSFRILRMKSDSTGIGRYSNGGRGQVVYYIVVDAALSLRCETRCREIPLRTPIADWKVCSAPKPRHLPFRSAIGSGHCHFQTQMVIRHISALTAETPGTRWQSSHVCLVSGTTGQPNSAGTTASPGDSSIKSGGFGLSGVHFVAV